MFFRRHKRIEVHRWMSAYLGMKLRVDIVGTAFKRMHLHSLPDKQISLRAIVVLPEPEEGAAN